MKRYQFAFFLSFLFFSSLLSGQTLEHDRLALVAFYNATDGANWIDNAGWIVPGTPGDDPCGWFGVGCWGGRVAYLDLTSNNLTGNIPAEIGDLTELTTLVLRSNNLTGNIPSEIGNLTNLTVLWLQFNNLNGTIPNSITNLSSLISFSLRDNNISGTIPSTINNLTNLEVLWLGGNPLSGQLPPELGMLSNLKELRIEWCSLNGSIPITLQNLSNLIALDLRNNMLNGTIPSGLANINSLEALALEGNQLSGPVPDFSALSGMNTLWIRFNRFTFEGIEQNLGISNYLYNIQAPIPIFLTGSQLSVNAGGNIANSTYKWYEVGTGLVATIVGNEAYVPAIPGDYYVQVTNSNIPDFTLTSEIATIPCTTEVCDGVDNDCDGQIDEGFDFDGDGISDICDPIVDVNGAVATLKDYIEDANINGRIANSIIQRLCLAEIKFCDYGYVSSVLSTLDYLVSYISYQSGRGIPTADADYLISQIQALSTAIANGNAECTNAPGSSARLSGNTRDTDYSTQFQIFPNPAEGQLSLTQKEYTGKKATVMITNNLGVLLRRTEIEEMPAEALTLDLSGLPGGHYFLTLEVEGGSAVTKRFVIAR